MTVEDAVAGIAATVTAQGLKCTAVVDDAVYPTGTQISDEQMDYLEFRVLDRAGLRGQWNYTVLPAPRQGPEPEPGQPGRPGPDAAMLEALAVLAGVRPPATCTSPSPSPGTPTASGTRPSGAAAPAAAPRTRTRPTSSCRTRPSSSPPPAASASA